MIAVWYTDWDTNLGCSKARMWCSLAWITGSWQRCKDPDVIGFTTANVWDGSDCSVTTIFTTNAYFEWFLSSQNEMQELGKCQPAQKEHVHWAWDVHLLDFQGDSCFHWLIYGVSRNDVQQLILKSMNERSLQMEWCRFYMTIWSSHVHHRFVS